MTSFLPPVPPEDPPAETIPTSGAPNPGVAVPEGYGVLYPTSALGSAGTQNGVIFGPNTVKGRGVFVGLQPSVVPTRDETDTPRTGEANTLELANYGLDAAGHVGAGLEKLARMVGATYFVGFVAAGSDSVFQHNAGRILSLVVLSVALNGTANRVFGHPGGGGGGGINVARWTTDSIAVRAQADGEYAFLVL